jgi:GGDEF domain-containing protein
MLARHLQSGRPMNLAPSFPPDMRHQACSSSEAVSPMTELRFHDRATGLLTHDAFSFIVDHLLKHALRTQEFLTLVIFVLEHASLGAIADRKTPGDAVADARRTAEPQTAGQTPTPSDPFDPTTDAFGSSVSELARLIRHTVRETDLVGYTTEGMLSLMLESTTGDRVAYVLERLDAPLERFATASTLRISIGAASCPTDAIRLEELLRHAMSQRKVAH